MSIPSGDHTASSAGMAAHGRERRQQSRANCRSWPAQRQEARLFTDAPSVTLYERYHGFTEFTAFRIFAALRVLPGSGSETIISTVKSYLAHQSRRCIPAPKMHTSPADAYQPRRSGNAALSFSTTRPVICVAPLRRAVASTCPSSKPPRLRPRWFSSVPRSPMFISRSSASQTAVALPISTPQW